MATKHRPAARPSAPKRRTAKPARTAPTRASKPTTRSGKNRKPAEHAKKPASGRRTAAAAKSRAPRAGSASVQKTPAASLHAGATSHDLAVEVFEQGFRSLQERKFREAGRLLASVIDAYPDEKELHERARVYIAICERQAEAERNHAPRTLEERMNAATVALNRGAFEEGLRHLRSVERDDVGNDLVHYMMAVAFTGLGDSASAVPHLQQAIAINPDNRHLAAQDADLEALRTLPEFGSLLETAPASRRRPTTRDRSSR